MFRAWSRPPRLTFSIRSRLRVGYPYRATIPRRVSENEHYRPQVGPVYVPRRKAWR